MTVQLVGSGLICAALFAIGFDFVIPVSSAVSGLCDLLAVGSGIAFVGLLDGARPRAARTAAELAASPRVPHWG